MKECIVLLKTLAKAKARVKDNIRNAKGIKLLKALSKETSDLNGDGFNPPRKAGHCSRVRMRNSIGRRE